MRRSRVATACGWVLWGALACSSLDSHWPCELHPQAGCGRGEQCVFTNDGVSAFTLCVPVGRVQPGGDCSSPQDCAAGQTCVGLGGDPNAHAKCRRYCTSDEECAPGSQFCLSLEAACQGEALCGANLRVGMCLDECTPFTSECGPAATCAQLLPDFSLLIQFPTCRQAGAAAVGAACSFQTDCGADMFCMSGGDAGPGTCAQICDAGHTCPAGKSCESTPGDPLGECL